MIKLDTILKEFEAEVKQISAILAEKIIEIPEEVLKNADKVYNYVNSRFIKNKDNDPTSKEFWSSTIPYNSSRAHKVPEQVNFKFKNLKGQDIEVETLLFNDKDGDEGLAAGSLKDLEEGKPLKLWINMYPYSEGIDKNQWEELLEHELTHFLDPKKLARLKGKDFTIPYVSSDKAMAKLKKWDMSKPLSADQVKETWAYYHSHPMEFDAQTTALVNTVYTSFKKLPEEKRKEYRYLLDQFMSKLAELDEKNYEENQDKIWRDAYNDPEMVQMMYLFSREDWDKKNEDKVRNNFWGHLSWMASWALKSKDGKKVKKTLLRRFMERLYSKLGGIPGFGGQDINPAKIKRKSWG